MLKLSVASKDDFNFYKSSKILNANNMEDNKKFILAMGVGYSSKSKLPFNSKIPLFDASKLTEEDKSLMSAVAIEDTKNIDILSNNEEIFKIAEEYANAGIKLLKDMEDNNIYDLELEEFESFVNRKYDKLEL